MFDFPTVTHCHALFSIAPVARELYTYIRHIELLYKKARDIA